MQIIKRIDFDIQSLNIDNVSKQVYINHNNFDKIKNYSDKNIVSNQIDTLVNFTFAYKGQSPTSEREYEFITNALKEDIFTNFNDYTIEDVKFAFKLGVNGELGEYYGLNPKTFYDWLKSYKTKFLHPSIKNITPLIPKEIPKTPSQEEVFNINKNIICNFFDEYKKTNNYTFNDFGNMIYDFLNKIGLISFNEEEKAEILKESTSQLKIELANNNDRLNSLGKVYHKIDLKKAFQDIENRTSKDYNTQLYILAKKNALKRFIDYCVVSGVNLSNLINDKIIEYGNK